jgi:hypothetical protein
MKDGCGCLGKPQERQATTKHGQDLPGSCALLILLAKSEIRVIYVQHEPENRVCQRTNSCETDFASSITFGEGCPKGFVIQAVMPLSHFRGYHSDRFLNPIR